MLLLTPTIPPPSNCGDYREDFYFLVSRSYINSDLPPPPPLRPLFRTNYYGVLGYV